MGPFCRAVGIATPKAALGRQDWFSANDASLPPGKSMNPLLSVFASAPDGFAGDRRIAKSPRLYRLMVHGIGPLPS
jgi:hypothetical protein